MASPLMSAARFLLMVRLGAKLLGLLHRPPLPPDDWDTFTARLVSVMRSVHRRRPDDTSRPDHTYEGAPMRPMTIGRVCWPAVCLGSLAVAVSAGESSAGTAQSRSASPG